MDIFLRTTTFQYFDATGQAGFGRQKPPLAKGDFTIKLRHALFGLLAGFAILPGAASAQTVLRLAENQPDTNPVTVAMFRFADLVKKYTDGEIEVQVFSGAQLGQEPEMIEQAQAGIIDFTRVNSFGLANVSPSMGASRCPMSLPTGITNTACWTATSAPRTISCPIKPRPITRLRRTM